MSKIVVEAALDCLSDPVTLFVSSTAAWRRASKRQATRGLPGRHPARRPVAVLRCRRLTSPEEEDCFPRPGVS